jgi:hypothetical protein
MKFPKTIFPNSHKREIWVCECRKETEASISYVTSGQTTNCGRCNEISTEEMRIRKFGRLQMKDPKPILSRSHEKETWICDCGKEITIKVYSVISGNTKSCGQCRNSVYEWYLENKESIRSLKCPVEPSDFPVGGPILLETVKKAVPPFKCVCIVCKSIYYPRLRDIKQGKSLTCGCSSYRISSGQKDVSLFIESLGFKTELEYKINEFKYDIFVPSINLLIEYNGTHWHSTHKVKERDLRKGEEASDLGYGFLPITESSWMKERRVIKDHLATLLNKNRS